LLLATLGIYGVVSYSVRQRTVEIGTRMALGAVGRDVLTLVVGGGLKMAAYGLAAGGIAIVVAAWLLTRFFDLRDSGVLPAVLSAAAVAGVTAVASFAPASRAALLSPLVAIRNEPGSLWSFARQSVREAVATLLPARSRPRAEPIVFAGTLLTEFVAAARGAESFPEALRIALATLCSRLGATSALLLERRSADGYRCVAAIGAAAPADCALPDHGFLLNRLTSYPHPLPLTAGEFDTLLAWSREHAPWRVAEIQTLEDLGARIAVPLRTKSEIFGVLLLSAPADREGYDLVERQLLQNCAEQFALMIENARLTDRVVEQEKLRRDLALAAEVQKRLLPERPPATSIGTLAAASLPARSVGGDYYDFIDVGDHRLGIALADVSGKGVAAALIMSVVQASLRVISSEGDASLPQLVAKMNRFLHRSTGANSYATFFYAEMDERTRQLRYVNAGHNPPYLVRSNAQQPNGAPVDLVSSIDELSTGGAVIGLFPQMHYAEGTVDLRAGDLLVAFTDGVTEALNTRDEEFGEERLKALLCRVAHLSAHEISARISDELKTWIEGAVQHDDLTFIVMKVS
jgi:serine phosphatase RsbU (regulator of sigma subunit)